MIDGASLHGDLPADGNDQSERNEDKHNEEPGSGETEDRIDDNIADLFFGTDPVIDETSLQTEIDVLILAQQILRYSGVKRVNVLNADPAAKVPFAAATEPDYQETVDLLNSSAKVRKGHQACRRAPKVAVKQERPGITPPARKTEHRTEQGYSDPTDEELCLWRG